MKQINVFFTLITVVLFLSACGNDENPQPVLPLEAVSVTNLAADPMTSSGTGQPPSATGKFTLFSLRDNAIVANSDSATNKWDIGFRATTIIINGGAIRSGQGGAYIFTGLFDDLVEIPESQVFNTDESITELAIPTGSGNGWFNYNFATNWISPIAGRVLVIRTGDGKYAKVEILSYYKDAPQSPDPAAVSRHYTFKYIYQPNGSKKF